MKNRNITKKNNIDYNKYNETVNTIKGLNASLNENEAKSILKNEYDYTDLDIKKLKEK